MFKQVSAHVLSDFNIKTPQFWYRSQTGWWAEKKIVTVHYRGPNQQSLREMTKGDFIFYLYVFKLKYS